MQNKEVRVDLKVSRRESGLLQSDLAHLLETTQPRISKLEHGKAVLTLAEALKLTVIFGKPVSKLFRLSSARVGGELARRLETMPHEPSDVQNPAVRAATINRLSDLFSALNQNSYGKEK